MKVSAVNSCEIPLSLGNGSKSEDIGEGVVDLTIEGFEDVKSPIPRTVIKYGCILITEEEGKVTVDSRFADSKRTCVAVLYDEIPSVVKVRAGHTTLKFHSVFATNINYSDPVAAVQELYLSYQKFNQKELRHSHIKAWKEIWRSGIEIEGYLKLGTAINSSLYYILSNLRPDWTFGISPGGIPFNAYK